MPGFDDPAQVESIHFVGNQVTVTAGGIDREAAIAHYTDQGFDRLGERSGFTLLEGFLTSIRPRRVFAIGDDGLVAVTPASSDDDALLQPLAEAVVAAAAGEADRYHEANDAFRRLMEALPAGDTIGGAAGPPGRAPEGFLANGTASVVGSSTTDLEAVVRFEPGTIQDEQSLVDRATSSQFFQGAEVETSIDDGEFRATGSVPTAELERLPLGIL